MPHGIWNHGHSVQVDELGADRYWYVCTYAYVCVCVHVCVCVCDECVCDMCVCVCVDGETEQPAGVYNIILTCKQTIKVSKLIIILIIVYFNTK